MGILDPPDWFKRKHPEAINAEGQFKFYQPAREYLEKQHNGNLGRAL